MPREDPVTSATRRSVGEGDTVLTEDLFGLGERTHVDDVVGVDHHAELVLDRGDQRHVSQRVPLLDAAVLQRVDLVGIGKFETGTERGAEPVNVSHVSPRSGGLHDVKPERRLLYRWAVDGRQREVGFLCCVWPPRTTWRRSADGATTPGPATPAS